MPDKVNHDYLVEAFSALSDDVICTIGATLDHYIHLIYKNKELAHALNLDNHIIETRVFAKLIRTYLNDDDLLLSDLENIFDEK